MLHRHRFAGSQQRAVEHGVRSAVGLGIEAGRHVEAPRFDAALPVAPGESEVFDRPGVLAGAGVLAREGGACTDEVGVAAVVAVEVVFVARVAAGAARCVRRDTGQRRDALCVSRSTRDFPTSAVRDTHSGVRHHRAPVERRHPGQCVLAAQLEVHRQIGRQRGRAHVHRAVRAVALVQKRIAELLRSDLQHVETRRQRYADDFERSRVAGDGRLGHVERLHFRLTAEQRQHSRLHAVAFFFIDHLRQRAADVACSRFSIDRAAVVVAANLSKPRDDFRVGLRIQIADLPGREGLHLQCRLHASHRDRHHRHAAGLGQPLDHAEGRSRELRQRGHRAGRHGQWKALRAGQRTAGRILKPGGQRDVELGQLRERRCEGQRIDDRVIATGVRRVERRVQCLSAALDPDLRSQFAYDRRVEAQFHRPQRQAGCLRVLALAVERHGERLSHVVREAFFDAVADTRRRRDAFAVDQLDATAGGQRAVALQRREVERIGARGFVAPHRLEKRIALGAFDQPDRNPLADAVGGAPDVVAHARERRRTIEFEDERLLLVDPTAARADAADIRAAGAELVPIRRLERLAGGRPEPWRTVDGAANAGRQVVLEVEDPLLFAGPAGGSLAGFGVAAADGERRRRLRISEIRSRAVEFGDDLPDPRNLALWRQPDQLQSRCIESERGEQEPL